MSSESTPAANLRTTPVVTSFLMRDLAGGAKATRLLIVQRSQRVGSYHGHWAGISGFIESGVTADEQAYTEIREETGLERDQVRMLKRGEVVEYQDQELGRHFLIHPYLFEVLEPEAIKTDWEAVSKRWIDPAELSRYEEETVPRLREAYESASRGQEL